MTRGTPFTRRTIAAFRMQAGATQILAHLPAGEIDEQQPLTVGTADDGTTITIRTADAVYVAVEGGAVRWWSPRPGVVAATKFSAGVEVGTLERQTEVN